MDLGDNTDLDTPFEWESSPLPDTHSISDNTVQPSSYHTLRVPVSRKSKHEPFAFINSTGPEIKTPETRKLVREYAAQSRDSSRKRSPSSRKALLRPATSDPERKDELPDKKFLPSQKTCPSVWHTYLQCHVSESRVLILLSNIHSKLPIGRGDNYLTVSELSFRSNQP